MKKIKLFLLPLLLLSLLTGCAEHNERGYVIKKIHTEPYTTTHTSLIYTGKVCIPVIYTIRHSESWSLNLRDEVDGYYKYYVVYLKDTDVWDKIKVGDYFVWSENYCYDCEPTTRGRQG